jgi:HSP20 family protein
LTTRRWDPLQDLLGLQERINRLFEESLTRLDEPLLRSGCWAPPSDVLEFADTFVVQVELPGIPLDGLEIHASNEMLRIRGERRLDGPARPESFHRMERSYGPFSRAFRFPTPVDPDGLSSDLRDGLLRVELPKASSRRTSRPRR